MARDATNGQPSNYAREKLPAMRARWRGAAGDAVRAMGPEVWPETPLPALLGVTANAVAEFERYCEGFCAIGLYQIPESTWNQLRTNATVRRLLGDRDAVPASDFAGNVPDQVATGLVSLRRDLDGAARALPAALRPTEGSQWQLALAVMGYVVGAQTAGRMVARHADDLDVAEPERFGRLAELAAADGSREMVYPVTRAWQRLATGAALADELGQGGGWYRVVAPRATEAALAVQLYGPGGAARAAGGSGGWVWLAAAGAGAWWLYKRSRR